jgi:bacterioferritin-associated ferredoxin
MSLGLDLSGSIVSLKSDFFSFEKVKFPISISNLSLSPIFKDHKDEIEIRLGLRQIWFKTLGVLERPYLKKGRSREELLCRCAGVYSGDLKDILHSQLQTTFAQMIQLSRAASTCMSCVSDVEQQWQQIRNQTPELHAIDASGKRFRPLKLAPADFALLLDEHLELWREREKIPTELRLEICALEGLKVYVRVDGTDKQQGYLQALEEYWRSTLSVSVQVAPEV